MAENTPKETARSPSFSNMSQRTISNAARHLQELSATNSNIPTSSLGVINIGARTMERSRRFVNNISTTLGEIPPFMEQVRLTSLLNLQRQNTETAEPLSEDTFAIDVGALFESSTDSTAESQNNNNDAQENPSDEHIHPEARRMFKLLQRYIPLLLILFVKCIYDYRGKIVHFVVLLVTTIYADGDLKREIAKQQNRVLFRLFGILLYITGCISFLKFVFDQPIFSVSAEPTSAWDLLWTVAMMDFMLKLLTIALKVILTCLPAKLLPLQKRGQYYQIVEATSQLYRCIAPIQPWLYYLYESYKGAEKFLGIFLCVAYVVSKISDLSSRVEFFRHALRRLLQKVCIGVYASKEQLLEAGENCTICHDSYTTPITLHCKHVFCELCVITWLDRERSCPLCRSPITDNPIYRDGHTTFFIQLF